jgi:RNA polymerase sigma-70 factor (ECF subfamily)
MGRTRKSPGGGQADQGADPVQLAWDRKIWEAVAAANFSGPLYDRLIDQMIRYSLPKMRAVIRSGRIFVLCYQRNGQIKLSAPSRWTGHDHEDLALKAVAEAARRFQRTARTGQGWSPSGGASLATFFMGMCIDEFPNQFHAWLDTRKRLEHETPVSEPIQLAGPAPDDAELARETLREALRPLTPAQQKAIYLQAQGYSHKEIATMISLTPRAVEGLIHRGRQRLNPPGEARA